MHSSLTAWTGRIRRRLRPVRTRLTVLATLLVALTLTVAAGAVLYALYQSSRQSADVATTARARQIAAVVESKGLAGLDESLLTDSRYVDIIQVVDDAGHVVFSGERYPAGPLGSGLRPGEERRESGLQTTPDGPAYRGALVGALAPGGEVVTVEVGAAESRLDSLFRFVAVLAAVMIPIIVIGTAVLTHYFVARTLKPVDDIRRQVDDITGGDLDQRVPVPDTGDEIATLATTMNAMLERIGTARAEQMRFVNDASHELNSPLTTLVGLLDLSRTTKQPIDPETVATVMMPEALRLQGMVSDLLFLARADERGVPLRLADVDIDEVVSAEVARLEALGRHTITAKISAVRVQGDGEKLARALRNIADNASHHTHDRLDFAITVDADRRHVSVTVSDNGPGIADADKSRVLQRFVRLDTVRERSSGGSGLGLAIVDEIVRAHHGNVTVADAPDGGATVGFTLPVPPWSE
ncbi:sensor histidine kinase [Rhodococcus globerulus]|uniref:sensor histidine kinase n=1 Tax=Rhodococcus globerulus TaxID=33008 RepID=UPI0006909ADA|nr:HAMP domain-containing sensor histidine kinase [Rhodococcus globerulus]